MGEQVGIGKHVVVESCINNSVNFLSLGTALQEVYNSQRCLELWYGSV